MFVSSAPKVLRILRGCRGVNPLALVSRIDGSLCASGRLSDRLRDAFAVNISMVGVPVQGGRTLRQGSGALVQGGSAVPTATENGGKFSHG